MTTKRASGGTIEKGDRVVDILLHEHRNIKDEVFLLMDNFKKHVRLFQIVMSAVFAGMGWLFVNMGSVTQLTFYKWDILYGFFLTVSPTAAYLVFDFLHTTYSLTILGARSSAIESQIKELVGPNLLIWEKISAVLNGEAFPLGLPNPSYFQAVITSLFFILLMFVIPLILFLILRDSDVAGEIRYSGVLLYCALLFSSIMLSACFIYSYLVYFSFRKRIAPFIDELMKQEAAPESVVKSIA